MIFEAFGFLLIYSLRPVVTVIAIEADYLSLLSILDEEL
jgi:hypothetical protein